MKNILLITLLVVSSACSSPVKEDKRELTPERLKDLQAKDEVVLNNLEEEPLRQGTVKKETEGRMTTETWSWKDEHGSPFTKTETLIFKDGKLVSQSVSDPESGVTWSRQYRNGKVFQINEERKDGAESVYIENDKISGRMIYGHKPECLIYDNGMNPRIENTDVCENRFNTAP